MHLSSLSILMLTLAALSSQKVAAASPALENLQIALQKTIDEKIVPFKALTFTAEQEEAFHRLGESLSQPPTLLASARIAAKDWEAYAPYMTKPYEDRGTGMKAYYSGEKLRNSSQQWLERTFPQLASLKTYHPASKTEHPFLVPFSESLTYILRESLRKDTYGAKKENTVYGAWVAYEKSLIPPPVPVSRESLMADKLKATEDLREQLQGSLKEQFMFSEPLTPEQQEELEKMGSALLQTPNLLQQSQAAAAALTRYLPYQSQPYMDRGTAYPCFSTMEKLREVLPLWGQQTFPQLEKLKVQHPACRKDSAKIYIVTFGEALPHAFRQAFMNKNVQKSLENYQNKCKLVSETRGS